MKKNYPALAEALIEAASPQIRNLATLGGNLCQRPRCWYFRNGHRFVAQGRDGKELVAAGENRYHAILGNDGPAKFVSPSTIVPVLDCLRRHGSDRGSEGEARAAAREVFRSPQDRSRTRARSATE